MDKPQIDYPCPWPFKIIGADAEGITRTVNELMGEKSFQLKASQQSRQGTYTSFNLYVQVQNEEERDQIFQALQQIPSVKIVI